MCVCVCGVNVLHSSLTIICSIFLRVIAILLPLFCNRSIPYIPSVFVLWSVCCWYSDYRTFAKKTQKPSSKKKNNCEKHGFNEWTNSCFPVFPPLGSSSLNPRCTGLLSDVLHVLTLGSQEPHGNSGKPGMSIPNVVHVCKCLVKKPGVTS